jgi:hypothetical protein
MSEPSIFDSTSPLHGLRLHEFEHLSAADSALLVALMARISEKSFRRGFQQGWDSRERGDKVCDLERWRFSTGIDVSVSPHDTYHDTAVGRLFIECRLENVGLKRPAQDAITDAQVQSHISPLFARHRKTSGVRKSVRFCVLRRDGFRCVYCGATAGEQKLHVDHVHPRSKGGRDDESNLVTSCEACNLGKSNRHVGVIISRMESTDGR